MGEGLIPSHFPIYFDYEPLRNNAIPAVPRPT